MPSFRFAAFSTIVRGILLWGMKLPDKPKQTASAYPTKSFFVNMITRDITLEDCILDLIDNSVDGAWRSEGSRPAGLGEQTDLSKYWIEITANEKEFRIADNCGGMTLADAADHAFSFGRPAAQEQDNYSIGVYGIGMKRAVFKIGREIAVRSTYTEKTGNRESFVVPINVDQWITNDAPPWDFDLNSSEPLEADGVEITVTALNSPTAASFGNPAFEQNLRRTIARDYSLHLNRGLVIRLNEKAIEGWIIELREGADFAPVRVAYEDEVSGDEIGVEIIAGMAAPPPESSEPDEEDEGDKRYGWYVVCNGRIVLAADKTSISGWDTDDWPQWHRQYSGFIGIVLFTAANAAALPLTTTKRSVDQSSEVYRRARPRMREATRAWIRYTNTRKQAPEAAKAAEQSAQPVPIYRVAMRSEVSVPQLVATPKSTERIANVSYSVQLSRLKRLSREFGAINMPYREVGLESFNYAYKELVGEE